MDSIDQAILRCLTGNSRMQWKEIGQEVHLTGQAVAERVQKMQDRGWITGYTVKVDDAALGLTTALVTVFMKGPDHVPFLRFVQECPAITEAQRISGDGCYWLRVLTTGPEALNEVLDAVLRYGNYRVQIGLLQMK